jgi:hypothetical protein
MRRDCGNASPQNSHCPLGAVQRATAPVAGFLFMVSIHCHTLTRKLETETVILVQPVGQNIRPIP